MSDKLSPQALWPLLPDGSVNPKSQLSENTMHYRNGREAKNGDTIVRLNGGKIEAIGVLHNAVPGNDHCNGMIAPLHTSPSYACMCDCLHLDDLAELLKASGLGQRPAGM